MAAYGLQRFLNVAFIAARHAALALVVVCALSAVCNAQTGAEKPGFQETVIGSSFKLMAKTYVLTTDLEKLKKKHITQIQSSGEDEFRFIYAKTLGVIAESPRLKSDFGLDAYMDRDGAVDKLKGLNKDRLCRMIDAVPDSVIASRVASFMARRVDEMKGMDLTQRISHVWNSFRQRLER